MDRRRYLALVGSGLTLSIAGCTGDDDESGDNTSDGGTDSDGNRGNGGGNGTDNTTGDNNGSDGETGGDGAGSGGRNNEPLTVGDSVTSNGLEISVTEFELASEYTEVFPDGDEGELQTASPGAVFLFIKVTVTHDGETEKTFPGPGDVDAFYLGDKVDRVVTYTEPNYRIDGTIYTRYDNALDGAEREGVFPGTEVQGWVIFEVPENFDQTETEIEIEDDEFSEEGRTYRWELSE
jgi:hypothetical protein